MNYLSILKKCIIGILIIVSFLLIFKLTIFYIPFLIAYIISIIVDPAIKFVSKKTTISRKISSIIVLITIFSLITALLIWGIVRLVRRNNKFAWWFKYIFRKSNKFRN